MIGAAVLIFHCDQKEAYSPYHCQNHLLVIRGTRLRKTLLVRAVG